MIVTYADIPARPYTFTCVSGHGTCGHVHQTLSGALRCRGDSNRDIVNADGTPLCDYDRETLEGLIEEAGK